MGQALVILSLSCQSCLPSLSIKSLQPQSVCSGWGKVVESLSVLGPGHHMA
jgi:hypothetical protein